MQDKTIIDGLGGGKAVADALCGLVGAGTVTADQVYVWKARNQIASEWRPWVAQLAEKRKLDGFDRLTFLRPRTAA